MKDSSKTVPTWEPARVRQLRVERGLTLQQVGEAMGYSEGATAKQMAGQIERGGRTPSAELVVKLCIALACSPNELFGVE